MLDMNKLTVLLVDDHEGFINAAMRHFRKIDWLQIVGSAGNGLEAIERSETLRPQVVLMDLAMPEMGGLQATRLIKSQDDAPYIVIASHFDDAEHREHALRAGADNFRQQAVLHPGSHADPGRPQGGTVVSESRILVLDNDAVRAERTVALLEFMDFNPRWVSDAADFDLGRQRQNDWMAVIVGSLDDSAASTAL
jgi:CheY-like chemotaxis protein